MTAEFRRQTKAQLAALKRYSRRIPSADQRTHGVSDAPDAPILPLLITTTQAVARATQ